MSTKPHCKPGKEFFGGPAEEKAASLELLFSDEGWPTLYRCPVCHAYWEMSYPGRVGIYSSLRRLPRNEYYRRWKGRPPQEPKG